MNFLGVDVYGSRNSFNIEYTVLNAQLEPGSYFFSLKPLSVSGDYGFAAQGYAEVVLSPNEIQKHRRFSDYYYDRIAWYRGVTEKTNQKPSKNQKLDSSFTSNSPSTRICFWGSNSMDGQKQIWLQQMKHLNSKDFQFTWVSTERITDTLLSHSSIHDHLIHLPYVKVVASPFIKFGIDLSVINAYQDSDSQTAFREWDGIDEKVVIKFMIDQFHKAKGIIQNATPKWVQDPLFRIYNHLKEEACGIVVYGNNRGYGGDVLLIEMARELGIPTVAELLNLFIHPEVVPTVIVGPSTFAVEHESILALFDVSNGAARTTRRIPPPLIAVIPPAVDAERYYPWDGDTTCSANNNGNCNRDLKINHSNIILHPGCLQNIQNKNNYDNSPPWRPCFVIGFVGRLAVEKNPGLFLQAAAEILKHYPFARFTIVGDGPLAQHLRELSVMLEIETAVHFTGWLSDELPSVLRGWDIVVNPSLRAWSETFCIANIEAMISGVTLVTFGVGGIGEYVLPPQPSSSLSYEENINNNSSINQYFSVTPNAVLLNEASIFAITNSVLFLIENESIRKKISIRARADALSYFVADRQIRQYEELYKDLRHRKGNE